MLGVITVALSVLSSYISRGDALFRKAHEGRVGFIGTDITI